MPCYLLFTRHWRSELNYWSGVERLLVWGLLQTKSCGSTCEGLCPHPAEKLLSRSNWPKLGGT